MSLLQGWIADMHPVTYTMVFDSHIMHRVLKNRTELDDKLTALALAKTQMKYRHGVSPRLHGMLRINAIRNPEL